MEDASPSEGNVRPEASATGRPTHSPEGVDLTLIRWMLSLTPAQRLDVLEQHLNAIASLRDVNPEL